MKPAPTRPSLRISKETFLTMRGVTGFERVKEQLGVYAARVAACLRTDLFLRKHRSRPGAEATDFHGVAPRSETRNQCCLKSRSSVGKKAPGRSNDRQLLKQMPQQQQPPVAVLLFATPKRFAQMTNTLHLTGASLRLLWLRLQHMSL